jgi:hypothetical protein
LGIHPRQGLFFSAKLVRLFSQIKLQIVEITMKITFDLPCYSYSNCESCIFIITWSTALARKKRNRCHFFFTRPLLAVSVLIIVDSRVLVENQDENGDLLKSTKLI